MTSSFFENAAFANPSNETGVPCTIPVTSNDEEGNGEGGNGDTNEDPQSASTSAADEEGNGDTNEDPQSASTSAAVFQASANMFVAAAAVLVVSCFYF